MKIINLSTLTMALALGAGVAGCTEGTQPESGKRLSGTGIGGQSDTASPAGASAQGSTVKSGPGSGRAPSPQYDPSGPAAAATSAPTTDPSGSAASEARRVPGPSAAQSGAMPGAGDPGRESGGQPAGAAK